MRRAETPDMMGAGPGRGGYAEGRAEPRSKEVAV